MATPQGTFVWYELMTSDAEAARAFYEKVVGWNIVDSGLPGMQYLIANVGDRGVAGLMNFPPEAQGTPPGWIGYIAVDDVDAMAQRVQEAGGAIHRPPADIPGVGRFSVVMDPQGAVFMLFKGAGDPQPDVPPGTPGGIGWHELHSSDWEAGSAFYEKLFGWTKSRAVDMGEMGVYQVFGIAGVDAGGMMNNQPAAPPIPPHWSYYFNVDGIDAAVARVAEAGGKLMHGPHQVPGGTWIAIGTDPQGAWFALTSPGR